MRHIPHVVWVLSLTVMLSDRFSMTFLSVDFNKDLTLVKKAEVGSRVPSASGKSYSRGKRRLSVISGNPEIVEVITNVTIGSGRVPLTLSVQAGEVGESKNSLDIQLWESLGNRLTRLVDLKGDVQVQKLPDERQPSPLLTADPLMYLLLLLVLLNKCAFGCKIDLEILGNLWKQPRPVIIGVAVQFVWMPFYGFLLTRLVQLNQVLSLGFIMACSCPSGGGGYLYALFLDADVTLAISMTFISTVLAVVLMPVSFSIYSFMLGASNNLHIPYLIIGSTLLSIALPISFGIFLKQRMPNVAKTVERIIRPFSVIIITGGFYLGFKMGLTFLQNADLKLCLLGLLVPPFGLSIGYLFAGVFKLAFPVRKTVAIESGVQNTLLALAILQFSFSQPEANLSSAAPFVVAISAACEMILLSLVYTCRKRYYNNEWLPL
ncbi:sodium/bile acid cotransporter 5 [Callorhinchus milii]|uniref:Solute carrier family 10 member 5 n=1 Tax=Callorhinchus milii TaxID=7868 RepID=A0A4W3GWN2_CALMI|nr:sodium/bile acid cotransporter 5 [Callorhinchus milii]|eukprot:gi/632958309/ref/XP_007894963.1/ PREDICTED: sodium/bile acid cotransporter 5 [Callorhinchus milii]